jgi:DUF438 domain-containing protein
LDSFQVRRLTWVTNLLGTKNQIHCLSSSLSKKYEKFAEDPGKDLTEGLIPVYVGTFDSLTPEEFNQLKDGSTSVGHAITMTEAKLKEKNDTQPEQEPIDWEAVAADQAMTIAMMKLEKRDNSSWVGLTDADKEVLLANLYESVEGLITAIEAKLKDKNGW